MPQQNLSWHPSSTKTVLPVLPNMKCIWDSSSTNTSHNRQFLDLVMADNW
jgi:hypothetical protein